MKKNRNVCLLLLAALAGVLAAGCMVFPGRARGPHPVLRPVAPRVIVIP